MKRSKPHMAERAVLGSALVSEDASVIVCEELKAEHFQTPSLRKVFEAIRRSLDKGYAIDVISISDILKDRLEISEDTFLFLQGLTEDALLSQVRAHCDIVKNAYAKQRLERLAEELKSKIREGGPATESIRFLDDQIIKLQRESDTAGLTGGRVTAREMFQDFSHWLDKGDAETHFPFPFEQWNEHYLGYARGEVIVIFGYSSDGKSVLGFQFLEPLMAIHGLRLGVFSLEMSSMQLARRMLSSKTEPFWKIRNKELTDLQIQSLKDRAAKFEDLNMDIYNGMRDSVQVSRDTLRNKYDVIMVDHLHRMPYKNRMELEEHMRNLKSLAISADCTVIVLAQTARAKGDKASQFPEPTTNQLRDTDIITMEADWAVSAWQPRDSNGARMPEQSLVRMQKARDGEADTYIECEFKPNIMQFVPRAPESEAEGEEQQAFGYSEGDAPPPTGMVF